MLTATAGSEVGLLGDETGVVPSFTTAARKRGWAATIVNGAPASCQADVVVGRPGEYVTGARVIEQEGIFNVSRDRQCVLLWVPLTARTVRGKAWTEDSIIKVVAYERDSDFLVLCVPALLRFLDERLLWNGSGGENEPAEEITGKPYEAVRLKRKRETRVLVPVADLMSEGEDVVLGVFTKEPAVPSISEKEHD